MVRGTSSPLIFEVDEDLQIKDTVILSFKDTRGFVLNVERPQLSITATEMTVTLTQEQTLALHGTDVKVQYRACDAGGLNATASEIIEIPLGKILREGVIGIE